MEDRSSPDTSRVSTAEMSKPHKIWCVSLGCLVATQLYSFQAQMTKSKHRDVSALDIPST